MAECCSRTGEKRPPLFCYSDWMGNLPLELQTLPINQLSIPGSHDSFTSSLTANSDVAPNCPAFVRDLCRVFGSSARRFIFKWSVTQALDLKTQLMIGIRYIDLRVSARNGTDTLYFSHGLYGRDVLSEMKEVAEFVSEHPKEIIFLDFNHFYNCTHEQHQSLQKSLIDIFGEKMVPVMEIGNITLQMLWENHLQVFIFYHNLAATKKDSTVNLGDVSMLFDQAGSDNELVENDETESCGKAAGSSPSSQCLSVNQTLSSSASLPASQSLSVSQTSVNQFLTPVNQSAAPASQGLSVSQTLPPTSPVDPPVVNHRLSLSQTISVSQTPPVNHLTVNPTLSVSIMAVNRTIFWPGQYMPSPWANTYSTKKLLDFLEKNYQSGRPSDSFYVTQGILTPDGPYVFKHLFSNLRKTLCLKGAQAFVQWVEEKRAGPQGINICILDYVELDQYIPAVIELNTKLLNNQNRYLYHRGNRNAKSETTMPEAVSRSPHSEVKTNKYNRQSSN